MSRVELYRDHYRYVRTMPRVAGKWRWRFVKNGRVMADSGQGYSRRIDALNGCAIVLGGSVVGIRADFPEPLAWIYRHRDDQVPVHDLTREAKS